MKNTKGWVGGLNFVRVRRGSKLGRAGGAHSEPVGRRKTRATGVMARALQATWRKMQGRRR